MRNHGLGLSVGVGTDIFINFVRPRLGQRLISSACLLQYRFVRRPRSWDLDAGCGLNSLAMTERNPSTNFLVCGNLFPEKFRRAIFHSRTKYSVKYLDRKCNQSSANAR